MIWMSLVTGLFFLVLLLNQRWSLLLRLQGSHCSTFRIMCDVPSIAVFCSESIECFPGTGSKFSFKLLVTIPVAPIITGTIVHFRFHIRCISIHKLLYFNFFSASFCTTFLSYYYYYYYYYYYICLTVCWKKQMIRSFQFMLQCRIRRITSINWWSSTLTNNS